ncbi:helix-hairpin-helix domain-containing protein [Candidatus Pacearchaeota archaeon]|nr:helix-hairpin-helix domain-containing protein [Candidatus Pacearchaeota archaeon]
MKKLFLIIFFLFFLNFVYVFVLISGSCDEDQIDINSASLDELDKLYGIGPAKSQAIVDARPYENIDELTNAYGIGPATLEAIKSQGLACVNNDEAETENSESDNDNEEAETENSDDDENKELEFAPVSYEEENTKENKIEQKNEVIKLNPKTIKTEENVYEEDNKKLKNYALYLFFAFSLVIVILIILKKNSI